MTNTGKTTSKLGRRAFLQNGTLLLFGATIDPVSPVRLFAGEEPSEPSVRVGMVTDLHFADKPAAGTRHYRETLTKLAEAAVQFEKDEPNFVVELGDFIDAADSVEVEMGYLKRIQKDFSTIPGKKHFVLGNHCVYTLTKDEFLDGVEQERSFYSFDVGGHHFVVLDSCFRSDGTPYGRKNFEWTDPNIPAAEIEWLRSDLKATTNKVVVFVHQRLDVNNHYGVKNAEAVRKVLEDSGKVLAVFQGHSHQNDYREIAGIHYCTLVAMVEGSGAENNGFSVMDIMEGGVIRIAGYRKQNKYEWR